MEEKIIDDIKTNVRHRLDLEDFRDDEEVRQIIMDEVIKMGKKVSLTVRERKLIENEIFNSIRRLDILQPFIEDESISEIMINGPDHIFIERDGKISETGSRFSSDEVLNDVIQRIVGDRNKIVNTTNPIVDTRLSDGSRVNIVLAPISMDGSAVTIRKFPKGRITMKFLIEKGSISMEAAKFLDYLVKARYNIFVSGGTSTGKTTFLNALTEFIPENERVISIEDSCELQLIGLPNLIRLEARSRNLEGNNEVTIRDLVKTSLRMRPDRIIVGECRGAEAAEILTSYNTGHDGGLSTAHSNSAEDMISRLESMALMAETMPLEVIRKEIASGIEIMVHLAREPDGKRVLEEISEITGIKEGKITIKRILEYRKGEWNWVGKLEGRKKMENYLQTNFLSQLRCAWY